MSYRKAEDIRDFNEDEFLVFAEMTEDRWNFLIPFHQLRDIDTLIPDHHLVVKDAMLDGRMVTLVKIVKKQQSED